MCVFSIQMDSNFEESLSSSVKSGSEKYSSSIKFDEMAFNLKGGRSMFHLFSFLQKYPKLIVFSCSRQFQVITISIVASWQEIRLKRNWRTQWCGWTLSRVGTGSITRPFSFKRNPVRPTMSGLTAQIIKYSSAPSSANYLDLNTIFKVITFWWWSWNALWRFRWLWMLSE